MEESPLLWPCQRLGRCNAGGERLSIETSQAGRHGA